MKGAASSVGASPSADNLNLDNADPDTLQGLAAASKRKAEDIKTRYEPIRSRKLAADKVAALALSLKAELDRLKRDMDKITQAIATLELRIKERETKTDNTSPKRRTLDDAKSSLAAARALWQLQDAAVSAALPRKAPGPAPTTSASSAPSAKSGATGL